MPDEADLRARLKARDSNLRRLQRLTAGLAVAMTALATIFAGLAAHTAAGRKLMRVQRRTTGATARAGSSRKQRQRIPPPPSLPAGGSESAPAPVAPAQPPAATPAPPVVVTGGS